MIHGRGVREPFNSILCFNIAQGKGGLVENYAVRVLCIVGSPPVRYSLQQPYIALRLILYTNLINCDKSFIILRYQIKLPAPCDSHNSKSQQNISKTLPVDDA